MFYNLSKHEGHCLHARYGQFTCYMFLHHEYRVFCQLYLLLGLAVRSGHLGCLLRGHIYQEGLSPTACITHGWCLGGIQKLIIDILYFYIYYIIQVLNIIISLGA